jgi:hypothetical protein
MASYKGQTRTAYTEAQRKQKAAELASEPVVVDTVIETESKQEPKKRGRKPKEV